MTYGGADGKNLRRDVAREKARAIRDEQRKKERRNRHLLQGGIVLVLVAVAAVIFLVVQAGATPPGAGPLNMQSDGIVIGKDFKAVRTPAIPINGSPVRTKRDSKSSVITIRIYIDYFCPYCNEFETANKAQLSTWMKEGAVTLEIHPISILDRSSLGTEYSTRAAAAAGCVATYDPDDFWAFTQEMYVKQPKEGTVGLTNSQIIGVMQDAGVTHISQITKCVNDGRYKSWVAAATTRALNGPLPDSNLPAVTETPTVIVDGLSYVPADGNYGSASEFAAFLEQASGASFTPGTSTPTPSPTPTSTSTK